MCEYCGCRAVTAIDDLTREHHLVASIVDTIGAEVGMLLPTPPPKRQAAKYVPRLGLM
jgi:hypothetical protein